MLISLLKLWTGPLPDEELFPDRQINPLLHWFFHPIKRHLAKWYLQFLKKFFNLQVIGITGSTGKTTTANLLYQVLSTTHPTVKTADSITTTYNLPTTILKCTPKTRFLILEMGVEYQGDMDFYTWLARPNISLLLNINPVHSTFLGTLKDISKEKSKLLYSLPQDGLAIINCDDPNIDSPDTAQVYKFGFHSSSFVQAVSSQITSKFETEFTLSFKNRQIHFTLPIIGPHLISNLSAVITVAKLLSISETNIQIGLNKFQNPSHRLQVFYTNKKAIVIDDTYNANPASSAASIKILKQLSQITNKTPVLIFGQMNELGSYENKSHQNIGKIIKQLRIKHLLTIGKATINTIKAAGTGSNFDSFEKLAATANKFDSKNYCVLIKGSRSWHLERLVDLLK